MVRIIDCLYKEKVCHGDIRPHNIVVLLNPDSKQIIEDI